MFLLPTINIKISIFLFFKILHRSFFFLYIEFAIVCVVCELDDAVGALADVVQELVLVE